MITEPGLYPDLPAEDYHADPALSSSGARKIIQTCPALYWHERQHGQAVTKALSVGSAAHEWLLEGDGWPRRHHVLPEGYRSDRKAWAGAREEAEAAEAAGLRLITADDFATIQAMRQALEAHEFAATAFRDGRSEVSMWWRDETPRIWCRGRLDFLPDAGRIFPDYKTCLSAEPEALRKHVVSYGYHMQAAWYRDGLMTLGVHPDPIVLFVFQEKRPPFLVTCVALDEDAIGWGRMLNDQARAVFARCQRTGRWPGYADDILTLPLPGWEQARLQRMSEAGALDFAMLLSKPLEETA